MTDIKVAVFDVDGVLLDSLDAHLQVCRDEAVKLGLDIQVPDARQFRGLVARGAVISPMVEFFRTVGFPSPMAELADEHYRNEFARNYPVRPFAGIPEMLEKVAATGVRLGIVTSNTRAIISPALGDAMRLFAPQLIFADDDTKRVSKSEALVQCSLNSKAAPSEVVYVGDQPRDFAAAQTAHTQFLGVSYGWGIADDDTRFPLARSPAEIASHIRTQVSLR